MYYNAIIALPLTLLGAAVMGEFQYTLTFPHVHNASFWASVGVASCAGVFITWIVFLCTTVNGPLVTSITGNAKDVIQTVAGALLFRDFVASVHNVTGILISFAGAALFSGIKLQAALAAGAAEGNVKKEVEAGEGGGAAAVPANSTLQGGPHRHRRSVEEKVGEGVPSNSGGDV